MVWNKRVGVGVGVRVSKLRGSYGQTCLQSGREASLNKQHSC